MEEIFKNLLEKIAEKIAFVQNYMIGLPVKNSKAITHKISELNDEIKKDIGE
jgi:hypothetical protein